MMLAGPGAPAMHPHAQSALAPAARFTAVAYMLVLKDTELQSVPIHVERATGGARYTADCVRQLFLRLGIKPRYVAKAVNLVWGRLVGALPELCKKKPVRQRSRAALEDDEETGWAAYAHDAAAAEAYIALSRGAFRTLLLGCLADLRLGVGMEDLKLACSLHERRRCLVVLLAGTSGSGKSTLASLLASRLGITTVLSTDSVRHLLRSFQPKDQAPLLWASTYEAGELLPCSTSPFCTVAGNAMTGSGASDPGAPACAPSAAGSTGGAAISRMSSAAPTTTPKERCIQGYKAQCKMVAPLLAQLVAEHEARGESLVLEGVHLSLSLITSLMQRHPAVVPFLVVIQAEAKHMERMAVRAKYMTLEPAANKYVAHMDGIRWIQEYLLRKAEKRAVPCVENTNVDRSVGLIHATLLGVLRRVSRGEPVYDAATRSSRVLAAEFSAATEAMANRSQGILELTQQRAAAAQEGPRSSGGGVLGVPPTQQGPAAAAVLPDPASSTDSAGPSGRARVKALAQPRDGQVISGRSEAAAVVPGAQHAQHRSGSSPPTLAELPPKLNNPNVSPAQRPEPPDLGRACSPRYDVTGAFAPAGGAVPPELNTEPTTLAAAPGRCSPSAHTGQGPAPRHAAAAKQMPVGEHSFPGRGDCSIRDVATGSAPGASTQVAGAARILPAFALPPLPRAASPVRSGTRAGVLAMLSPRPAPYLSPARGFSDGGGAGPNGVPLSHHSSGARSPEVRVSGAGGGRGLIARSSSGGMPGNSSAADSDGDISQHLPAPLDYASLYESTAAYDDGDGEEAEDDEYSLDSPLPGGAGGGSQVPEGGSWHGQARRHAMLKHFARAVAHSRGRGRARRAVRNAGSEGLDHGAGCSSGVGTGLDALLHIGPELPSVQEAQDD